MSTERRMDAAGKLRWLCDAAEGEYPAFLEATDEGVGMAFCSNPSQYEWKFAGNRNVLIPCIGDGEHLRSPPKFPAQFPIGNKLRFELRKVWIFEGRLHRGESNLMARRSLYMEDPQTVTYGEGFDADGNVTNVYLLYDRKLSPSGRPGQWYMTWNARCGGLTPGEDRLG